MPDEGNGFKFKTVEDLAKLHAAFEVLSERVTNKIDGIHKDMQILSNQVANIRQPCEGFKQHLEEHKTIDRSSIGDWIKRKPIQSVIIGLFIISQLGISLDRLVEIITEFIK